MSNDQCRLFVHNFAYFSFFIWKTIYSKIYLNKFKLHHLYMYLYLCVWINLYDNNWLQIRWETQLKKINPNIYYGPYTSLLLRIIFYKCKTVLGISWLQWLDSTLSGKAFKSLFDVLNWKKQSISGTSELF